MKLARRYVADVMPTFGDDSLFDDTALRGAATSRQATRIIGDTGDRLIDGVLSGFAWRGGITYAFPNSRNAYSRNYSKADEPDHGFAPVGAKMKAAVQFILDQQYGSAANNGFAVEGFTSLSVSKGSDTSATLRYASSSSANPTAYAYYPSSGSVGGDVWFGKSTNYSSPVSGNYAFVTAIHETGHALGLKHGHEKWNGFPTLPAAYDSLEYSVMTYRSYAYSNANSFTNEKYGFPQTFMMSDIAALQHMYGANFSVNSTSTVYSWKPGSGNTYVNGDVAIHPGANRIFATIWDGGGAHDTYDLSAYTNGVKIDLEPGAFSVFKKSQLADLDARTTNPNRVADGNIYNALQYKSDARSLIEDATGGKGNDTIYGNVAANFLNGGMGNDELAGRTGNDTLRGGSGSDLFIFRKGWGNDIVADFGNGDVIDLRSFKIASYNALLDTAADSGTDVVLTLAGGELRIEDLNKADLHSSYFLLA